VNQNETQEKIMNPEQPENESDQKTVRPDLALDTTDRIKQKNKPVAMPEYKSMSELPFSFYNKLWVENRGLAKGGFTYFTVSNKPGDMVYRFNEKFNFQSDSSCRYLYLAPNDAHHMKNARWTYNNNRIDVYNESDRPIKHYMIYSVTDTLWIGKKIRSLNNAIWGQWRLVQFDNEDYTDSGYKVTSGDHEMIVFNKEGVRDTLGWVLTAMQYGELNSIRLNKSLENNCPWLYGSFYGVRNDTFVIKHENGVEAKLVR